MSEVKQRFGKRLVIVVAELDSGKERRLTPETDPDLPVKVAVRMSMGVPGMMEPFRYNGHCYVDGGIVNDFPVAALPADSTRLGLMVRNINWIGYNLGSSGEAHINDLFEPHQEVKGHVPDMLAGIKEQGTYPCRDAIDLMTTTMNVMMDANLMLQIKMAT